MRHQTGWRRLPGLLLFLALALSLGGALAAEDNLLTNADFSQLDGQGLPTGWQTDAWVSLEGYTLYGVETEGGVSAVTVNNVGSNDARFSQVVRVQPESLYCFSADIRTEGISDEGWGANLSVNGVYAHSQLLHGTDGWTHVDYYGETGPDQREVTVYLRVGGYSGESTGKAWFRNVSLTEIQVVPGSGVADRWFTQTQAQVKAAEETAAEAPSPFWPWLVVIGMGYLLLAILLMNWLMLDRHDLKPKSTWGNAALWVGLAAAFALRLILSMRVAGYSVDVNCFSAWANRMADSGVTHFYDPGYWCDYPPAYMLVLGFNRWLSQLMPFLGHLENSALVVANTLIPMLCDLGIAAIVYHVALRGVNGQGGVFSRAQATALGLLVAFNPVLVINSAAWKQIDSVLVLLLVAVAICAIRRQWAWVMPLYVLAVLTKPQALMLGFLGLEAIVLTWAAQKGDRKSMLWGVGFAAALALAIIVPFGLGQDHFGWLIERYAATLDSYSYATVNTANLYYLFRGNWVALTNAAPWAVCAILALICLAWGAWCWRLNTRAVIRRPLPWLESVLMGLCAVFMLVCLVLRAPLSVVGYGAMALAFMVVLPLYWRGGRLENLPLLGGLLYLLLYVLGIKMHERYIFPAVAFFALAYALHRDRRTLLLTAVLSATVVVNIGIPLDNAIRLGASLGHLNEDTRTLADMLSIVNVLCVLFALWLAGDLCMAEYTAPAEAAPSTLLPSRHFASRPTRTQDYKTDASLHWSRWDSLLILLLTAAYAVVGFWHVGSMKAPQTFWTSTNPEEQVVLDLGEHHDDFIMAYYCGVSNYDFSIAVSDDGESWSQEYWAFMAEGQCFIWKYLMPSTDTMYIFDDDGFMQYISSEAEAGDHQIYHQHTVSKNGRTIAEAQKLSGRYVRITAQQINLALGEVIFRETAWAEQTWTEGGVTQTQTTLVSGAQIPATFVAQYHVLEESTLVSSGANICDEPDALEGEPSWYNSTYFDEIYHARTGYEMANGTATYETTHPPMGKMFISWCVSLFGMTPFGWRFAGVMAGVLMIPAMYLIAKQLTKRTGMAALAAGLMALDGMHFAQTRIATIDSYPVLFIILCFFFMLRFMQRDPVLSPLKKLLPDLALSGLFMGCAIASKWIGVYAGAGLAVLYFWTLARSVRMWAEAKRVLQQGTVRSADERERLTLRKNTTWKRLSVLCLCCLVFFVAVPLVIYLVCYIPFFAYKRLDSLSALVQQVIGAQNYMLSYHSQPGLGMDHAFYSPWYQWPLMQRPMYYYSAAYNPHGLSMAIWCFGNPAVWVPALLGLAWVALRWLNRHRYTLEGSPCTFHLMASDTSVRHAFVLLGFLAQFLPWVLVPRGTYIYHYFASVPFLILATVLLLDDLTLRFPRTGRITCIVYVLVCAAFFVVYYPYWSGALVSYDWLNIGQPLLYIYYTH